MTMEASAAQAIARGCAFLDARQLPSGEIPVEVSADYEGDGAWRYDPTVFGGAMVGLALTDVAVPQAQLVRARIAQFLQTQAHKPAVWKFWTAESPQYTLMPFDVDDTACAAKVLQQTVGRAPDSVERVLLANRDRRGRFYTWLVPHRGTLPRDPVFWHAVASRWRHRAGRREFWELGEVEPGDVDAVVNANVVYFLGDRPETRGAVDHLVDIVTSGREAGCDKFYQRLLALHHAVARAFAGGVGGLARARETSVARILSAQQADGSFGDPLDTALGLLALSDWGHTGPEIPEARAALIGEQLDSGGWPLGICFVGGPLQTVRWGSQEVTTGFCVQALSRPVGQ